MLRNAALQSGIQGPVSVRREPARPVDEYADEERRLASELRAALPWNWSEVQVDVDAEDRALDVQGRVKLLGLSPSSRLPVVQLRGLDALDPSFDLHNRLLHLHRASRWRKAGRWYHCRIRLTRLSGCAFEYWSESDPIRTLDDLHPRIDARLPSFLFERPLCGTFLASLPAGRAFAFVGERVARLRRMRRPVAQPLLQIAAVHEWLGALDGGGMDRFFFRYESPAQRDEGLRTFTAVHACLDQLNFDEAGHGGRAPDSALSAYREAVRVYAPHVAAAADACRAFGLEPEEAEVILDNGRVKQLISRVRGKSLAMADAIGQYVRDNAAQIEGYDQGVACRRDG